MDEWDDLLFDVCKNGLYLHGFHVRFVFVKQGVVDTVGVAQTLGIPYLQVEIPLEKGRELRKLGCSPCLSPGVECLRPGMGNFEYQEGGMRRALS